MIFSKIFIRYGEHVEGNPDATDDYTSRRNHILKSFISGLRRNLRNTQLYFQNRC